MKLSPPSPRENPNTLAGHPGYKVPWETDGVFTPGKVGGGGM